jgi:hypothetical protein
MTPPFLALNAQTGVLQFKVLEQPFKRTSQLCTGRCPCGRADVLLCLLGMHPPHLFGFRGGENLLC